MYYIYLIIVIVIIVFFAGVRIVNILSCSSLFHVVIPQKVDYNPAVSGKIVLYIGYLW